TCCRPTRAATSTSCAPCPARPPRASRSGSSAAGSAAGDLEHDLAARARRLRERRERIQVVVEPEAVGHDAAGLDAARVEQLDDAAPRGRGVAEARGEREVV